ncbi:MAG TPA: HD domain-containing phosphohydrolase [Candidatus Binatia bacterium]|nr:HD domain-containing phosphohydrolase [Candidatus Binatia bacterium]
MAAPSPRRGLFSRVRILWLVLGALLLVSLVPILLFQRQVLQLSQEKLEDTERRQQVEITRLLAEEILLFESNLNQQLQDEIKMLELAGVASDVSSPQHSAEVTQRLEEFVKNNPDILYVTALNVQAKGPWSGNFRADQDPFVGKALQRGFMLCVQGLKFSSGALAIGEGKETISGHVVAVPILFGTQPQGMLAVVVSLDHIVRRLQETSGHGREVYVVDAEGHIVAFPDRTRWVAGADASQAYPVVAQFRDLPRALSMTVTSNFSSDVRGKRVAMMGAFSPIPEMRWAVIAQRSLADAQADAGLPELTRQALWIASLLTITALIIGYFFAVGISNPVRALAHSTRAISRGEFQQRAPVAGAAEISDLAENFNLMAEDIERYIERLKQAAEENRQLFIGSIRMLAAAIDEKDPYTRGHSGRVAKYSVIIGEQMGLDAEALDKLRISALLHDVGKIGIDDRVLKKPGALTDEEFHIMKQHPVKGANIMRPVPQLKEMLPGIELHHECVDGRGYPYGLKKEQIPMMARIIAVADTFDAITTNRPYQSAMDLDFALKRVRELAGTRFDPEIVTAMEHAALTGKLKLSATLVEV